MMAPRVPHASCQEPTMCRFLRCAGLVLAFVSLFCPPLSADDAKEIKVGIIGLDTSHVVAFTSSLNKPGNTGDLEGVHVVAAYPGGSNDVPDSFNRVEDFTKQ